MAPDILTKPDLETDIQKANQMQRKKLVFQSMSRYKFLSARKSRKLNI